MSLRLLALFLLALSGALNAGTITGTVRAKGPDLPVEKGGGDAYGSSRALKLVETVDYARLTDFVVYVDAPMEAVGAPASAQVTTKVPESTDVMRQRDANFDPHVLPIAVGTTVKWPNYDDIFHNVYAASPVKSFDLNFYKKDKVPEETFDKVGRVDVFCSIHVRMHSIVLVLPNRFFAQVDSGKRFVIRDVPPGTYELKAWHERLPEQARTITVPAEGEVQVDFVLSVSSPAK